MDVALLSKPVQDLLQLNASGAYRALVVHGSGAKEAKLLLQSLKPADLFTKPVVRSDEAQAALAGLWLWHDFLDESHTISQGIHSKTGSLWHAILHRREGDFSNSKYWYAKAAGHPANKAMATRAADIVRQSKHAQRTSSVLSGGWDVNAMVDLAEEVTAVGDDPRLETVIALQKAEWETAFEMTAKAAVASIGHSDRP